jgi:hypothetical protein
LATELHRHKCLHSNKLQKTDSVILSFLSRQNGDRSISRPARAMSQRRFLFQWSRTIIPRILRFAFARAAGGPIKVVQKSAPEPFGMEFFPRQLPSEIDVWAPFWGKEFCVFPKRFSSAKVALRTRRAASPRGGSALQVIELSKNGRQAGPSAVLK